MEEKNESKKTAEDISKGLDTFIRFFKEIYGLIYETIKLSQDYLKVLISVNTATILILIAFQEKIFISPKFKNVLMFSFVCLGISLFSALRTMIVLADFYSLVSSGHVVTFIVMVTGGISLDERAEELQVISNKVVKVGKKQKFWYVLGNYAYLSGMVALLCFVMANYLI